MIRQYNEPFKWTDEPQADGVVTNPFHIFSYTDITEKNVYLQCSFYSQVSLC